MEINTELNLNGTWIINEKLNTAISMSLLTAKSKPIIIIHMHCYKLAKVCSDLGNQEYQSTYKSSQWNGNRSCIYEYPQGSKTRTNIFKLLFINLYQGIQPEGGKVVLDPFNSCMLWFGWL